MPSLLALPSKPMTIIFTTGYYVVSERTSATTSRSQRQMSANTLDQIKLKELIPPVQKFITLNSLDSIHTALLTLHENNITSAPVLGDDNKGNHHFAFP